MKTFFDQYGGAIIAAMTAIVIIFAISNIGNLSITTISGQEISAGVKKTDISTKKSTDAAKAESHKTVVDFKINDDIIVNQTYSYYKTDGTGFIKGSNIKKVNIISVNKTENDKKMDVFKSTVNSVDKTITFNSEGLYTVRLTVLGTNNTKTTRTLYVGVHQ